MTPNTLKTIAYTFALWTVLSITLGSVIGWFMYRYEQRKIRTPPWPWER